MAIALVALTTGCSSEDRAEVAVAKCQLPVFEKLPRRALDREPASYIKDVEDLGEGAYRVTGTAMYPTKNGRHEMHANFTCEVAPDPTDTLRGFKVTNLEVGAAIQRS